jgi:hypothetical protein
MGGSRDSLEGLILAERREAGWRRAEAAALIVLIALLVWVGFLVWQVRGLADFDMSKF